MVVINEDEVKCTHTRKTIECTDNIQRFKKENENYYRQLNCLYLARLRDLSKNLAKKAQEKFGKDVKILTLSELEAHEGARCVIIGTLFKDQPNKPSILHELSQEHQMAPPAPKLEYCSEEDQLFLEDQTSRIKLTGNNINIKESVTGVVCAVIGRENAKSNFEVEDWCFPGCVIPSTVKKSSSGKLMLVSGLELATFTQNLSLTLLTEWLQGLAGLSNAQEDEASIIRLIIAGNSIKGYADQHLSRGLLSGKKEDVTVKRDMTLGMERLDSFLESVGTSCQVTLMPGQFDITTLMMPQRAMHPCSFPKARKLKSIKGVTNPWIGNVSERIIIGTSGQQIQDIQKVCGLDTLKPIEWLERSLQWQHMCPTAPDTLPCYPFEETDPFIIRECPDIYFVGNMEKFESKLWKGDEGQRVRLITIPKFSQSQSAVLVDLETLETQLISFSAE